MRQSRFVTILAANNLIMNGLMMLGGVVELIRLILTGGWGAHRDNWLAIVVMTPIVIVGAASGWAALRRTRRARLLNLITGLIWMTFCGTGFVRACFSHDRWIEVVRIMFAFYFGYAVLCTLIICSPAYLHEFERDRPTTNL